MNSGLFVKQILRNMSKKQKNKPIKPELKVESKEPSVICMDKSNNIIISILAKPGAKQNSITGITSEGVGVQINAPPTEGEANTELIKYIASVLGLRKSDVTLDRGFKSRTKTLKITGNVTIEEVNNKLQREINDT